MILAEAVCDATKIGCDFGLGNTTFVVGGEKDYNAHLSQIGPVVP